MFEDRAQQAMQLLSWFCILAIVVSYLNAVPPGQNNATVVTTGNEWTVVKSSIHSLTP